MSPFSQPYRGQYIGRFAPSPTGPLHAGSLVAALASWLDARAHGGQWLIRMEDVDVPRCLPGMDAVILHQLASLGLHSDVPVVYQSKRIGLYEAALAQLQAASKVYRCYCSRKAIVDTTINGIYSGLCRQAARDQPLQGTWPTGQYAYRLQANERITHWADRRLGLQSQNVSKTIGDFVVKRADRLFAYQLAVVVDDADQGISHIVRGEDLADNTARQIELQASLALPLPQYLHVPLVLADDGQKLSKQNGARAFDVSQPQLALNAAAVQLGLTPPSTESGSIGESLMAWARQWQTIYPG